MTQREDIEQILRPYSTTEENTAQGPRYLEKYTEIGRIVADIYHTQDILNKKVREENNPFSQLAYTIKEEVSKLFGKAPEEITTLEAIEKQSQNMSGLRRNLRYLVNSAINEGVILQQKYNDISKTMEDNRIRFNKFQIDKSKKRTINQTKQYSINDPEYFSELREKMKVEREEYKKIQFEGKLQDNHKIGLNKLQFLGAHILYHEGTITFAEKLGSRTRLMENILGHTKLLLLTQQPFTKSMKRINGSLQQMQQYSQIMKDIYSESTEDIMQIPTTQDIDAFDVSHMNTNTKRVLLLAHSEE